MKRYLTLLMALLLLALVGCSNSTPPSDASSNSAEQEEPTQAPAADPTPTPEPEITDVSFDPFFTYDGVGDDVVTGLVTEYPSFLRVTHTDAGHFHIKAHYDGSYDLLVNTSDPYDGGCTYLPGGKEITLEVGGSGAWHVEACRAGTSTTDTFSVHGDYVTPIFIPTSDVYHITAAGTGHIDIWIYSDYGRDLLVNTSDPDYDGKVMIDYKGKASLITICSERDVTITPVS